MPLTRGKTWRIEWQGSTAISWTATDPSNQALTCALEYSFDGGTEWYPLGLETTATSYVLNAGQLKGGTRVVFRVSASNGINTGTATVGPLTVVQVPAISLPLSVDFGNFNAGQTVERTLSIGSSGSGRWT